jgi:hypothetical protein
MALLPLNRLLSTIILVVVLTFFYKPSFAQIKTGNLLIYTVDTKGKPYSEYLIKLKVFDVDYQKYLEYENYATYVYSNELGKNIFKGLPAGKYQIYVQCSRTQTEAIKEIYFNPSRRISQVAITLDQKQYWQ